MRVGARVWVRVKVWVRLGVRVRDCCCGASGSTLPYRKQPRLPAWAWRSR